MLYMLVMVTLSSSVAMAKRHSLVDASTPTPSKKSCIIDWKLCILCQKDTKTGLECPARSLKAPIDKWLQIIGRTPCSV